MKSFRRLLENLLQKVGQLALKFPRSVLGFVLLLTIMFGSGLAFLYTDVSNESLFRETDPSLQDYQAFQRQFGRDDAVVAAVDVSEGFTPGFLDRLRNFENDLNDTVQYLDVVTSVKSITSVSDQQGELLITDLEDLWPDTQQDIAAFETLLREDPLFKERIVSGDLKTMLVVVQASSYTDKDSLLGKGAQQRIASLHDRFRNWLNRGYEQDSQKQGPNETDSSEFDKMDDLLSGDLANQAVRTERPLNTGELGVFVESVREVVRRHEGDGFRIDLAGGQLIDHEHKESIHSDVGRLIPVVFLIVFVVIYAILRNVFFVMISLAVVALATISTIGMMGWTGSPITPVAVALPPLLLTVGVSDSMHLISVYMQRKRSGETRENAILYAIRRSGTAVFFTSLTTAAGFLAFSLADIQSVSNFGIFAAFGVMLAFVFTVCILPAAIGLHNKPTQENSSSAVSTIVVNKMALFSKHCLAHRNNVIGLTVLICALALPGVLRVTFSHDVLTWFAPDSQVRQNTYKLDRIFTGLAPLEFVIDTGEFNGIYDPKFIDKLQEFHDFSQTVATDKVSPGFTSSVLDTLQAIHKSLYDNPQQSIPDDRDLIAQELLLFESSGADDVRQLIDSDFSKVRVTTRLSWADALDYVPIREALEHGAENIFSDTATVSVTGTLDLVRRALTGVIQSMSVSYTIALVSIFFLMFALVGRLVPTLLSMLPNIIPVYLVLGFMGYAGIPITLFTVLLGGIALGLVVDDTVHLVHGLLHDDSDNPTSALDQTLAETGPALLFTTVAVASGFLVFLISTNIALSQFGVLLALTIVLALLIDLALVPVLFARKKIQDTDGLVYE